MALCGRSTSSLHNSRGNGLLAVSSTIAERIDTSPSDGIRLRPFGSLSDNLYAPFVQLDFGIDVLDADGRGDPTGFEGKSSFYKTGDTTCRLTVAKVGFHLMAALATSSQC